MSGWQKGDLALCVGTPKESTARKGAVYTVRNLLPPLPFRQGTLAAFELDGVENPTAFAKWGFHAVSRRQYRKITPPKADESDREIINLMAGKKVDA